MEYAVNYRSLWPCTRGVAWRALQYMRGSSKTLTLTRRREQRTSKDEDVQTTRVLRDGFQYSLSIATDAEPARVAVVSTRTHARTVARLLSLQSSFHLPEPTKGVTYIQSLHCIAHSCASM